MTWIQAFSYAGVGLRPENRSDLLRNVAGVLFHAACVAIVFAFVLILTTGIHP
jgi:hypothetical protein